MKCVFWGLGKDYERIINQILFEVCKGNIEVEALVCKESDIYCAYKDGYPVVTKASLQSIEFDYLVVTASSCYEQIRKEALELGINEKKIINGEVFLLPLFDFKRYVQLVDNPVTILSDDCWGGYVYNHFKLPFTSPLINIYWEPKDYSKFVLDPLYYMDQELVLVHEGDFLKGIWPVGLLGDSENSVKLQFVHNVSFEEAKSQWERRVKRINRNNLFVKMGFSSAIDDVTFSLKAFEDVRYKKILFYYGEEKTGSAFRTERYIWEQTHFSRVDTYSYNDFMRKNYQLEIDMLKLLTGEPEFQREGYEKV